MVLTQLKGDEMFYGSLRSCDVANGDGCRVTLFVSGCEHRCKNCFNREAWDFQYGELFTDETLKTLLDACDKPEIAGLSILGGEPMHPRNQWTVLSIIQTFRERFGSSKNIWMWTGYIYEDLKNPSGNAYIEKCTPAILENIDVLVDGPFVEELKDISLQFRGSSNQRILHKGKDF